MMYIFIRRIIQKKLSIRVATDVTIFHYEYIQYLLYIFDTHKKYVKVIPEGKISINIISSVTFIRLIYFLLIILYVDDCNRKSALKYDIMFIFFTQ